MVTSSFSCFFLPSSLKHCWWFPSYTKQQAKLILWLIQWQFFHLFIQVWIPYNHNTGVPHGSPVLLPWLAHSSGKEFKELFHDRQCCSCRVIFSAPPFPPPDPTWSCRLSWTSSMEFTWSHCLLGHLTYLIKKIFLPTLQNNFQKKYGVYLICSTVTQTSGLMRSIMRAEGQSFQRLSIFKFLYISL